MILENLTIIFSIWIYFVLDIELMFFFINLIIYRMEEDISEQEKEALNLMLENDIK